jgi:anti-sigma regulatory factor (Ser/Thr protein kinase)
MQAADVPGGDYQSAADDLTGASSSGLQHVAMPYRGADELAAGVASFIGAAVAAGHAVLVAAAGANLDFLRGQLRSANSEVIWSDISSAGLNPARLTALLRRFAADRPGQTVWCVHEPVWPARSAEELREVHRHEALLNVALADAQVSMLCPYDIRLGAAVISCAERTHPVVIRGAHRRPSSSFTRGELPSECDPPLSPPPAGTQVMRYRDDLAGVRVLAAGLARRAGLGPDRVVDLVSAVSELAANTLCHTAGPGTFRAWATRSEVICQVDDDGQIADLLAGTERPDPGDTDGHRGLWLVHQVCDLAEMRTGPTGTTIRVHMRLDGWQ